MTKIKQIELKIANQVLATLVVFLALGLGYMISKEQGWVKKNLDFPIVTQRSYVGDEIILPQLNYQKSTISKAIASRRTRSDFLESSISIDQLHSILWSMQGITAQWGGRAVPTTKSSYPLQITILAKNIEGISGIYQYDASSSALLQTHQNIPSEFLSEVESLTSVVSAPVIFIISGDKEIHMKSLEEEKIELMYLEAGHAIQNAFLTAESMQLGLHTTTKYNSEKIKGIINLPNQEIILSMFSAGQPKEW